MVNAADMRERLIKVGVKPAMSTPEEFRVFLRKESKHIEIVLKESNVQ